MTDHDPAVETWRATGLSTGAQLRAALEANEALAAELAKATAEVERLRTTLRRTAEAGLHIIQQRDQALDEAARLRRQLAVRGGDYQLTDKALTALDQPQEKP